MINCYRCEYYHKRKTKNEQKGKHTHTQVYNLHLVLLTRCLLVW